MTTIDPIEVHAVIAPRITKLVKRIGDVPPGFQGEELEETLADWSKMLAAMLVTPEQAAEAIDTLSANSRFLPALSDIMKQACGPEWSTQDLAFPVPIVIWEEVYDFSARRIAEIYPLVVMGQVLLTRFQVAKQGIPDKKEYAQAIKDHDLMPETIERAAWKSRQVGYPIAAGALSLKKKASVGQGPPRDILNELINNARNDHVATRPDIEEQIASIEGITS